MRVYPVAEVADYLGITRQRVYQLIESGSLPLATQQEIIDSGINPAFLEGRKVVSEVALKQYLEYKQSYDTKLEEAKRIKLERSNRLREKLERENGHFAGNQEAQDV